MKTKKLKLTNPVKKEIPNVQSDNLDDKLHNMQKSYMHCIIIVLMMSYANVWLLKD